MIIRRYTFRSLFHPWSRGVAMILFFFFVTVTSVTSVTTMSIINSGLKTEKQMLGADILVVPSGTSIDINEALISPKPTRRRLPPESMRILGYIHEIDRATPQLYLKTLKMGCCTLKLYPIVGYDPSSDFLLSSFLGNIPRDLKPSQTITGCRVASEVPGKMLIYGHPFIISKSLPCTGMGVDSTIFLPIDTVRRIGTGKVDTSSGWSAILVRLTDRRHIKSVRETIEYSIDGSVTYAVPQLVKNVSDRIRFVERVTGAFIFSLAVMSILFSVLLATISANAHRRHLALIRSFGATPSDIARVLALEITFAIAMSVIPGMAAALAAIRQVREILLSSYSLYTTPPGPALIATACAATFALIVASAIAAYLPIAVSAIRNQPSVSLKGDN